MNLEIQPFCRVWGLECGNIAGKRTLVKKKNKEGGKYGKKKKEKEWISETRRNKNEVQVIKEKREGIRVRWEQSRKGERRD